ncbi:hypothetical protein [Hymenobacter pini]|uniref:hypothetical protein n=1 Tax=Hymenobacter pini TaxID=2880879 RepID=UPI001CF300DE|nr:hypothetical protein [Hymenobacter pini]MCA8830552.1 hypothetical protein [Hymenobacter pini]
MAITAQNVSRLRNGVTLIFPNKSIREEGESLSVGALPELTVTDMRLLTTLVEETKVDCLIKRSGTGLRVIFS